MQYLSIGNHYVFSFFKNNKKLGTLFLPSSLCLQNSRQSKDKRVACVIRLSSNI